MNANYILSYVNMEGVAEAKIYDRTFKSLIQLVAFVAKTHRNWSSFQIIVHRRGHG